MAGKSRAVEEVLPGVRHWVARHPNTGMDSSSHWVPEAGAVIDPLLPEEGIAAFAESPPDRVLLSNRHHLRHAARFTEAHACTIHCSELGLHEFADKPVEVHGFRFGEEVAPGIEALAIGAICPDETALLIRDAGAVVFADGITHYGDELAFMPDGLLGEDPDAVKRGLRRAYAALLERDFDNLLFAHGRPVIGGGKRMLAEFCA
jgi:hypothetical protein